MSNNQYTYRETYRRENDDHPNSGWKSWLGLDDNKNKDEYHYTRTVNRGDDRDTGHSGGWKSWFGMDDNNKSRDNDYHYSRTTTYRNDNDYPSRSYTSDNYNRGNTGYSTTTYVRDSDRDTGYNRYNRDSDRTYRDTDYNRSYTDRGYTGGSAYTGGYTSSDNYNRGVNVGGTYGTRGGYGYQTSSEYNRGYPSTGYSGDRDNYNRESTYVRSYNTDRDSGYSRDHPSSYESTRYTTDRRDGGYGTTSYGDRDRYGGSYSYNTTRSNY